MFLVVFFIGILVSVCSAGECHKKQCVINKTEVTEVTNVTNVTEVTNINQADKNTHDYGEYLNLIMFETENSEWGFLVTYLNESSEIRGYIGGKIYLNRITYQKK